MPHSGRTKAVQRLSNVLDGRGGYRIKAECGHISVLQGGGHIRELSLNSVPGVNPLWHPQWTTIDPDDYSPKKHRRVYGPPPDGKLLAGIAGHSLSFDHFGPPSKEETAAGLTTYGEAPSLKWDLLKKSDSPRPTLHYGQVLPQAQIDFRRTISVDRSNPVICCEEQATNLSAYDRPISWNEHVTFGPPFLECETTVFDMPATHAKVCPASYSEQIFLQPDAEFRWPNAPTKQGATTDLRRTPDQQFGHYTMQLLDPALQIVFVSACNPSQNFLVVYAFRRADFPWVGNWEERNNRTAPPWKARTFCRGIEFSTTPDAIPDETHRTILKGNTYPLARPEFDLGTAVADLPMERMLLVLLRSVLVWPRHIAPSLLLNQFRNRQSLSSATSAIKMRMRNRIPIPRKLSARCTVSGATSNFPISH
jgi:hypothetical protein